jgi:N-acetylglucosamine-6-sulfatase
MTRKLFLQSMAMPLASRLTAARSGRRNLVLIVSDDHAAGMLGCTGHPWLKTPNLDRMAAGGVLFRNAFATTSLCSPSRASILTGKYAHSHGVLDNGHALDPEILTFPRLLQTYGYRTGFVGKWHMEEDNDEPQPGFERWFSFAGQGVYADPVINVDGVRVPAGGYTTDILTREALRFIGQKDTRPFLLYLSHKAAHSFCQPAERHQGLYRSESVPRPATMPDTEQNRQGKPDWVRRQRNSWHGVDGMYDNQVSFDDHYRDYCRTLVALDDSVGQVLGALEQQQLLDDTLVIYMSDNGFQFGEHGLIDKRTMYEPSIRIPMIAHCPALFGRGRQQDGLALNLDIGPTLLDAAGAAVPPEMHGRSLLDLMSGSIAWRTHFLYEYFWSRIFPQTPTVVGLRTQRYSYMRYHGIWDVNELYDNEADPDQMRNLLGDVRVTTQTGPLVTRIADPSLRDLVSSFNERIFEILNETGAELDATWLD